MPEPMTITEAAGFIRRGELTPSSCWSSASARIDRYEIARAGVGPSRSRRGTRTSRAAHGRAEAGQNRGPLHGIPIGIKDIIDVFDMPTGCGSKLWANSYARRDATVVERLRQAGAVIMGKTVTTAYASFDPPSTRNPWNLDRTPGGSSSGSAAAVACGMCLGALATQTGGSITRPASYCGVYSIKPTYGRVSVDGVLPLAPSMDHVGAMANCVRDLAILFEYIAGPDGDPHDWFGTADHRPVPDCTSAIDGSRLGRAAGSARPARRTALPTSPQPDVSPPTTWHWAGWSPNTRDRAHRHLRQPGSATCLTAHRLVMAVEAAAVSRANGCARHPEDYPPRIRELIEQGLACRAPDVAAQRIRTSVDARDRPAYSNGPARSFVTPATTGRGTDGRHDRRPGVQLARGVSPACRRFPPGRLDGGGSAARGATRRRAGAARTNCLPPRHWCEADIGFERRPLPL